MKIQTLATAAGIAIFAFGCSTKHEEKTDMKYPTTAKADSATTFFGTTVKDPYRWLENDTSKETGDWVQAQNDVTNGFLDKIPYRKAIRERLEKLYNYERLGAPFKEGNYYYFYKNDGLQNQSVLYRKATEDGTPEVFLDPNTFSKDGTTALAGIFFTKKGDKAAYLISEGGSDWRKAIIISTADKTVLEDSLVNLKFTGIAWKGDEGFYYSKCRTRPPALSSKRCGACRCSPNRACASRTCSRRRSTGSFKGLYCQGEDIVQSDPNTQHVAEALIVDGMHRRAGHLPERDRQVRPRVPAGFVVPGEGRHVHQRGAPHLARAQGDAAEGAVMLTGKPPSCCRNALGYPMNYNASVRRSWTRSRALTPTFSGVSYQKLDALGSIQWPCNDDAPERHADHAHRRLRARQGQVHHHQVRGDRREGHAQVPADPDHGAHPVAVQRGRARRGAPTTCTGTTRTGWRSIRTMPRSVASRTTTGWASRAARARRCCAPSSASGCSRAWCTPRSTSPNPAPT